MKLEDAKKKLTPREYEFLEAMLNQDTIKLRGFGDDAVLLAKNVEFKLLAAGGLEEGPASVEGQGTQLKLFEAPTQEAVPEEVKAPTEEANSKPAKRDIVIPAIPGARRVVPVDLDGLEKDTVAGASNLDGLERAPLVKPGVKDILDSTGARHAPFRKGDVIRGDRVMYKATGGIHRVVGVDRTTTPETVKMEVFGKVMLISRELVAKVAPTNFDRRWQQRRMRVRTRAATPTAYETQVDSGYDPQDNSS